MGKFVTFTRRLMVSAVVLSLAGGGIASAATGTDFSQVINTGTLATDILDASRVSVASPTVAMSAKTFSFACQSGGSASTGTFGTNTQCVYDSTRWHHLNLIESGAG